ncbi:beta-ketoacyl synthase N-terminal-like domain-containing protein [Streptomyces sp. SAJ15]|uniref:beta-ketoacyl synthase N-terminal-like domain-containing protein n=1 Tax=Streptomyces sp. SAJ15 TaxID=2011095 RepID=UPI0011854A56|nr:beta-ketoacyl synthase N-terminal-like domain-containing protein [Streptomyces sp. SAJ15]TVL88958.1 3-oxoacyl-ACP synthase [Streptomyces sp. SAJ15]
MSEIVITGLGAVCRLGTGVDAFWNGVMAARTAEPDRVPDERAEVPLPLYYMVPGRSAVHAGGPASEFTVAAGEEAAADGRVGEVDPYRVAVLMGSSVGDARQTELARAGEAPAVTGGSPPFSMASALAARIGPCAGAVSLSNACSGSGYAIAMGAEMIEAGEADVVIAGGVEAYSRVTIAAFNRMGALGPERPRPFDKGRQGVVLGEGAGAVVLESAAHAAARGARAYARLAGSGWSCDAAHPTAPDPSGTQIKRAMRDALTQAGAGPEDVSFIVPHATGTTLNDSTEATAMADAFGDRLAEIPLHNLKAIIGHLAGGAGVMGTILAALAFHHGEIPPNPPLREPDPECPVHLPTGITPLDGGVALVNSYAFGGNNISLALQGVAA